MTNTDIDKSQSASDVQDRGVNDLNRVDFRVVTHKGRRYALKLENVFWKVLELAAAAKKQRLGDYVGELMESHANDSNKTSAIRVHAAEWLSKTLVESSSKSLAARSLSKIVNAISEPCFCIDMDNRFICQNAALTTYLRTMLADKGQSETSVIKMTFKQDAAAIRAAVLAGNKAYIDDVIRITLGDAVLDKKARIAGLETAHGRILGYFVLLQLDD